MSERLWVGVGGYEDDGRWLECGKGSATPFGVWAASVVGVDGNNKVFGHYLTLDEHSTKDQY